MRAAGGGGDGGVRSQESGVREGGGSGGRGVGGTGGWGQWVWVVVLAAGLAAGCWLRGWDLGRSATRSDELNQLRYAQEGGWAKAVELWKNPPWLNQIPLVDGVPGVWCEVLGLAPEMRTVRQPFALAGMLALAMAAGWCWRRRGARAGALCAWWLGMLPYAVHHAREAYYYAPLMAFGAWMSLRGVDLARELREKGRAGWWRYGEWFAAAWGTCLCHMSGWAVTAAFGAWILWAGLRGAGDTKGRARHAALMGAVGAGLGAGMWRWVMRALEELHRVETGATVHTGYEGGWVLLRAVPTLSGGLWAGTALAAAAVGAGLWLWRRGRRNAAAGEAQGRDAGLRWLGAGAWGALAVTFAYVGGVGNGAAKWAYFAASAPIWVVWCSAAVEAFWRDVGGRRGAVGMAATVGAVAVALGCGGVGTARVQGKPTAYKALRDALDAALEPGDVAVPDRWLEPWNEMAIYAPRRVWAGFTVPDEPYEQYVAGHWREVTQRAFEEGEAQAFVRLTRNHEGRMGPWRWPEEWFRRRTAVRHAEGIWLAKWGAAAMEEYYTAPSRLETEIFWDTHEDSAEKARARGARGTGFWGEGFRWFKPWMHGDWQAYRVLEGEGRFEAWNLTGERRRMRVRLTGAGMGGDVKVRVACGGEEAVLEFAGGRMSAREGTWWLEPGRNALECRAEGGGAVFAGRVAVE